MTQGLHCLVLFPIRGTFVSTWQDRRNSRLLSKNYRKIDRQLDSSRDHLPARLAFPPIIPLAFGAFWSDGSGFRSRRTSVSSVAENPLRLAEFLQLEDLLLDDQLGLDGDSIRAREDHPFQLFRRRTPLLLGGGRSGRAALKVVPETPTLRTF